MDSNLTPIVVVLTGVWLASLPVALFVDLRSGALLNLFSCGVVLVSAARAVAAALQDSAAMAQVYGAAALSEVRLIEWTLAASLLAFLPTLVAWWWGRWWFAVGWMANAPTVGLVFYLTFWLHIFG